MAEVEQLTVPKPEQADKEAPQPSKKKSNFKFTLIVIIASQLVLAAGGFFMVSQFIKPDPAYRQVVEGAEADAAGHEGENGEGEVSAAAASREIYLIEDVIVNPAETRGSRYLSISIGVEMSSPGAAESGSGGHGEETPSGNPLDSRKIQLRDALINILSAKTILQLTNLEEKENIRQEILSRFAEILKPETVHQIYFVDFVLQ